MTVQSSGTYTYTPTAAARHAASAVGALTDDVTTDGFVVTASDGRGGTLAVTVTLTISPKNSAPSAKFTAGKPNTVTGLVNGTVTSIDPDGDAGIYSGPTTSTKGGTVTVNGDGTCTYTPTAAARQDRHLRRRRQRRSQPERHRYGQRRGLHRPRGGTRWQWRIHVRRVPHPARPTRLAAFEALVVWLVFGLIGAPAPAFAPAVLPRTSLRPVHRHSDRSRRPVRSRPHP